MNELAQRLVDQGDVGFAEQVMDILGCPEHDPVEGKLEQIAALLDADPCIPVRRISYHAIKVVDCFHTPGSRAENNRDLRGAHENLCCAKQLSRVTKHPVEDRV